jgi:hypothetical protein
MPNSCGASRGRASSRAATAGLAVALALAFQAGCSSGDARAIDAAGAAKTLTDGSPGPVAKPAKSKRLQNFIDQQQRDAERHPKIR